MAIYRIFLEKDASIYTETPNANTGKDEILEIGSYKDASDTPQVIRSLVKVSDQDINNVIGQIIGHTDFSASINMYLAEASEIPVDFTLECYPVGASWDNGTGKFGDVPTNVTGVSWSYRTLNETNPWSNAISGSITGSTNLLAGGGVWYTTASSTQSFFQDSILDLNFDISNAIKLFYTGSLVNNGFIFKLPNILENNPESNLRLRYFSKDTKTIYPTTVDFKWDDSSYITGSLSVLNTDNKKITIKNNKETYKQSEIVKFRLLSKPTYPTRTFTTSSIYLTNYALSPESYWSIIDNYTEEVVIDFDNLGTKISCDNNGSYFKVYMSSLQPERFYRILIKTIVDETVTIIDDNLIFKVTRDE